MILLVNDEALSATILRDVLEAKGEDVVLAGSPTEAAKITHQEDPQTVLVVAPIVVETARLLRGIGYDGRIVGLAFGPINQEARQAALRAGVDDYRNRLD